jgi:DNA primase
MHIPEDIVEQIRRDADIVEIISNYLNLKKRGKNYVGLSPFTSEKTPSFVVSPEKQIFKDFSSGKGGNVFTFLMEYKRITFVEALQELAERLSINIPTQSKTQQVRLGKEVSKRKKILQLLEDMKEFYVRSMMLDDNHTAIQYFVKRGFTSETQKKFGLGYSPDSWDASVNFLRSKGYSEQIMTESGVIAKSERGKLFDRFKGRAIFPIKDNLGKVIGFGGRDLTDSKNTAKYINSPQSSIYDKSDVLYGFYEGTDAIRNKENLILVEGYADVISLHQAGVENVAAVSGTALTEKHITRLKRYINTVYLNYDSDRAGINAADKSIDICIASDIDVKIVVLPDGQDPDSIIREKGKVEYELMLRQAKTFVEFRVDNFLKNRSRNNPRELSDFLQKMVVTINKIKDVFVHDYYLNSLSSLLRLSETEKSLLYQQKSQATIKQLEIVKEPKDEWQPETLVANLKSVLTDAEIKIFSCLMQSKNIKQMIEELKLSSEFFQSDMAMRIFDSFESLDFTTTAELFQQIMQSEEIDEEVSSLLTDIALIEEEFKPSEVWEKFREIDNVSDDRIIEEAIRSIILSNLEDEIRILHTAIAKDPENQKLMLNYRELVKRREAIYEKES